MNTDSRYLIPSMTVAAFQSIWMRTRYRVEQGIASLFPRMPAGRDQTLSSELTPEQRQAFLDMSSVDQAHLLRVYHAVKKGAPEASPDLLVATLLHDIGKVSPTGRVRLLHRVLRVALAKLAPSLWARVSALPARGWRTGFVLAQHHPALGAEIARGLGCSPRTCWLIEHHGTRTFPIDDPELCLLVDADHRAR